MDVEAVRKKLVAQHAHLRADLEACGDLARQLGAGEPVHVRLDSRLAQLRANFIQHNVTETAAMRFLLRHSRFEAGLLKRMLDEHLAEHAALWRLLEGRADEVAARMDELVAVLEAHMSSEERTFLSPHVLQPGLEQAP